MSSTARRSPVPTSAGCPVASSSRSGSTRCPTRSPPAPRRSSATSSASASSACRGSADVHFLPTPDQLELQRGVRDLLDARYPLDRLPAGYDAGLWRSLDETGVFSLRTDLGLGLADAVLVFEQLGRAGVPGPLVPTLLARELDGAPVEAPVTWLDSAGAPLLFVTHLDIAQSLLVVADDDVRVTAA